jgi:hypothetical protein
MHDFTRHACPYSPSMFADTASVGLRLRFMPDELELSPLNLNHILPQ